VCPGRRGEPADGKEENHAKIKDASRGESRLVSTQTWHSGPPLVDTKGAPARRLAEESRKRAEESRRELVLESLFVVAGRQESRKVLHQGIRGSGPEKKTRPLWLWPGTFSFFFF
jgi:hypothetical protein